VIRSVRKRAGGPPRMAEESVLDLPVMQPTSMPIRRASRILVIGFAYCGQAARKAVPESCELGGRCCASRRGDAVTRPRDRGPARCCGRPMEAASLAEAAFAREPESIANAVSAELASRHEPMAGT